LREDGIRIFCRIILWIVIIGYTVVSFIAVTAFLPVFILIIFGNKKGRWKEVYCFWKSGIFVGIDLMNEKNEECIMDNSKEFQLMFDKANESESLAFKDFDRTKNVQDQLQEMIGNFEKQQLLFSRYFTFYCMYNFEIHNEVKTYLPRFKTWEQLWLAFIMKEKYNKVWKEDNWCKT